METLAAIARPSCADFSFETVELDDPRPDEVLVRILAVGVCHTDLVFKARAAQAGTSMVLGHEGAGTIEKVGAGVTKVRPGDHVVLTFRSCGVCSRCKRGDPAYCRHSNSLNVSGARTDGVSAIRAGEEYIGSNFFGQSSFAAHALAYERNTIKVDAADAPIELLAPLGCGVQTGLGAILRSLACEKGSSLLVLGGGAVGLSAVMGAAIRECAQIIVVEPHEARRRLALSLGATNAIDPAASSDIAEALLECAPEGVDYALDTTGLPELQTIALNALAPKGVLGVVGITPPGAPPPGEMNAIMATGKTIRGIIEGDSNPDDFIPEMIRLHGEGRLPLERLVKAYPFAEINRAIADQNAGECVKVVLLMDGS